MTLAMDASRLRVPSPEELAIDEATDRRTYRWGIALGVVVALFVLYNAALGYMVITTHQIIVNRQADLAQTQQAVTETKAAVQRIESLQISSRKNHTSTVGYLEAICKATPGCEVVSATP